MLLFFPCLDLLCLLVGSFWLVWFGVCFCIYPGTSFVNEQGARHASLLKNCKGRGMVVNDPILLGPCFP